MEALRFRIYYGDGSTYDGETDEDAFFAPATDVQVILQEDSDSPVGWKIVHGKDLRGHYCWRDGVWYLTDQSGYEDYLMCIPGPKKVLFGRSMRYTADFVAIVQRAKADRIERTEK